MAPVQIYSAHVCPYAQRSRMTLMIKGIDFDLNEIDLQNKPANFQEISPYGKVPVLKHGANRIWESAIINEYLDEVFPEPHLMPTDPGQRALARIWIEFANSKFTTAFYKLLLSQDPAKQQEWSDELKNHLRFMENEGLRKFSNGGPYWLGSDLSLVDISFAPWFERWPAIAHYRNVSIPDECTLLQQWWETMQSHPVMQETMQSGEFHIQAYAKYADATASGTTAKEMQKY